MTAYDPYVAKKEDEESLCDRPILTNIGPRRWVVLYIGMGEVMISDTGEMRLLNTCKLWA